MRRLAFATALATLLTTPALAGKVFVSNERGNTVTVLGVTDTSIFIDDIIIG